MSSADSMAGAHRSFFIVDDVACGGKALHALVCFPLEMILAALRPSVIGTAEFFYAVVSILPLRIQCAGDIADVAGSASIERTAAFKHC
jgi:hypothetical protein